MRVEAFVVAFVHIVVVLERLSQAPVSGHGPARARTPVGALAEADRVVVDEVVEIAAKAF